MRKKKRKKTLFDRVTKPVLMLWSVAIIVFMIALGIFTNFVFLPAIRDLGIEMLENKAANLSWYLSSQTDQLQKLGKLLEIRNGKQKCLEELSIVNQTENGYDTLGIIGRNGMIYTTDGLSYSIASSTYYRETVRTDANSLFSEPVNLDGGSKPESVVLLTKLRIEDETMEYLCGTISVKRIKELLKQSDIFGFCTRIIREEDGYVLMSVGQEQSENKKSAHLYDCPIKGWDGWKMELEIPNSFFYSQLFIFNISVSVVAFILYIVISNLMKTATTRAVSPIQRLSKAMNGSNLRQMVVAENDIDILEIEQLTNSFNSMIANTELLVHELEQKEMQKKDAEYEALIQQIKPHFLYNTLEMIQSMCLDYEDDRVENAIGLLADYFRSSLSKGRRMILLKEELHQVEDYLEIELLRFGDRFTYEIKDETGGDFLLMQFILQPIVENAIYHGVKRSSKKEHLSICCVREQEWLRITIKNTCDMYDVKKIETLNELFGTDAKSDKYPGYGLYNVNCRLKLHYGTCLHISGTDTGVCVTLIHPVIESTKEEIGNEYTDCRR